MTVQFQVGVVCIVFLLLVVVAHRWERRWGGPLQGDTPTEQIADIAGTIVAGCGFIVLLIAAAVFVLWWMSLPAAG